MLALIVAGCGGQVSVVKNTPPAEKPITRDATREGLLEKFNSTAGSINSINATVELKPTAGSKYSGVIEQYHEVKAFLLAARPADIRVIGQAPVIGTTVFDMASDGQEFRVSIPSKNKFLIGPVALERAGSKPIENLRPQHLLDAVLRGGYQTEILRKIWFDRSVLEVARLQSFGPRGILLSDIRFSNWQSVDAAKPAPGAPMTASTPNQQFPRSIRIERPHDDYRLDLQIAKITLNDDIPLERFKLDQPVGSDLIRVGESPEEKHEEKRPNQGSKPQGAKQ